ncbi:cilia and flagella associated protein 65, partial [Homo sapiens]
METAIWRRSYISLISSERPVHNWRGKSVQKKQAESKSQIKLHTQSAPFGLCPKDMMLTQAPSSVVRSRNSRNHTVNSGGSCLSASTVAIPAINDSSAAMSACSTISAQPASSMDTQMHSPKKQERVNKRVIWGIEVAEELHWKGWELGKETTRNLVLKNRSLKLQKMKYRPPKTKFFFTVIPQPIFLSPGITLTLPIVFRPLEAPLTAVIYEVQATCWYGAGSRQRSSIQLQAV